MADPLINFYSHYGYDHEQVREVVTGVKYVAVLLKSGNIGVCSTLGIKVGHTDVFQSKPDLGNFPHRIIYNAYLNALLNYSAAVENEKDIFDHINFSKRNKIVMVGYFRPLAEKFRAGSIDLSIFDKAEQDKVLQPYSMMERYLGEAETVILTSTSIFNLTFEHIISQTKANCDVFLLGPSSILHSYMKTYPNVLKVYGALFAKNDQNVLNLIRNGYGTRSFLKFGKKVNI